MASLQRIRLLVYSVFLVVLIVFAALYRPVEGSSRVLARPANAQSNNE